MDVHLSMCRISLIELREGKKIKLRKGPDVIHPLIILYILSQNFAYKKLYANTHNHTSLKLYFQKIKTQILKNKLSVEKRHIKP